MILHVQSGSYVRMMARPLLLSGVLEVLIGSVVTKFDLMAVAKPLLSTVIYKTRPEEKAKTGVLCGIIRDSEMIQRCCFHPAVNVWRQKTGINE